MKKAEIYLEYQPLLDSPPATGQKLYQEACKNDGPTVDHWKHVWLGNITANKQRFGSFEEHSVAKLYQKHRYAPAILAGSGPSLRGNVADLKNRGQIPLISCLHNFHIMEDNDAAPEYYVSLDSGAMSESGSGVLNIVEEIYEGGTRPKEEYFELTKNRTLLAFIGTNPQLFDIWKGPIYLFNCGIPEKETSEKIAAIEDFPMFVSSGGNVLGACLYISKAIFGSLQSIFVGADFSFGYNRKFHGWDSKYDATMGHTMRVTDVYGNSVHTWPSYWGFKQYFDSVSLRVPGTYYNCSEGGCLGAYPGGNLASFNYMDLKVCLKQLNLNDEISDTIKNKPGIPQRKILYS